MTQLTSILIAGVASMVGAASGPGVLPAKSSLALFAPAGLNPGDSWYLNVNGRAHMFVLQERGKGSARPGDDGGSIGHAFSDDLLHWQEEPVALRRGPVGAYDSGDLYTGCAVENEGRYYLFYCGNQNVDGRNRQSICLATSPDLKSFEKYPDNPVIEPDPARYYSIDEPAPAFDYWAKPGIDCRDLAVVKNPAGPGWLGYAVMRQKAGQDAMQTACIALCRSDDLVKWKVDAPCFAPGRYNCAEVPDVFALGDRYYMLALTGDLYGQANRWADPDIKFGTIVAEALSPEGPFVEVPDCLVLASNDPQGFAARTVDFKGERLMFYTRRAPDGNRISWPVRLVPRTGGGLTPVYWENVEAAFDLPLVLPRREIPAGDGQTMRLITGPKLTGAFMVWADIKPRGATAAGVVFGASGTGNQAKGYGALLDLRARRVALVRLPDMQPVQQRRWDAPAADSFRLRAVNINGFADIYVNDVLALQCALPEPGGERLGVFAREGAALFDNMLIWNEPTAQAFKPRKAAPAM